jgi:hypothetical protein
LSLLLNLFFLNVSETGGASYGSGNLKSAFSTVAPTLKTIFPSVHPKTSPGNDNLTYNPPKKGKGIRFSVSAASIFDLRRPPAYLSTIVVKI